jgi:hypothetical protein
VGKLEVKRPIRRPRRRCVDNINVDLVEIGLGGVEFIVVAEDKDILRIL